MTLVALPVGMYWPDFLGSGGQFSTAAAGTMDAATEKVAHIGHCFIEGRPGGTKTISAAGGGSIAFRTGTTTFANGATTLDIGIQDVAAAAGPVAQPDGTFDVFVTLTGGAGLTTAAWNTVAMTGGTGSKSIAHGDLIAIVWDMTARGGADSVIINGYTSPNAATSRGVVNQFLAGAWLAGAAAVNFFPNVVITFDDGTLGFIDGPAPISTQVAETFTDSTNPDERGVQFQVPFDCKIDAFMGVIGITDNASEFTLKLYSSPTSTPSLVTSLAVTSDQMGATAVDRVAVFTLPAEISLSKNTSYGLTMLATGTSNIRMRTLTLGASTHRKFLNGSTTLAKITRDGSSGNFTAEVALTTMYVLSVRISSVDDGTGAGGGSRSRIQTGF